MVNVRSVTGALGPTAQRAFDQATGHARHTIDALLASGWSICSGDAQRVRLWCPCARQHQMFIEYQPPIPEAYTVTLRAQLKRTCFGPPTGKEAHPHDINR